MRNARGIGLFIFGLLAPVATSIAQTPSQPKGVPAGSTVNRRLQEGARTGNSDRRGDPGDPYRVVLPSNFKVLQPLSDAPTTFTDQELREKAYYIPNVLSYVRWGILPNRDAKPIVTVPSGSVVVADVLSHEGVLEDQGRDPVRFFGQYGIPPEDVLKEAIAVAASSIPHQFYWNGPHVISPPLGVQGAQPGDVLKIDVLKLEPRVPYGVNSIRHGLGALPNEFPKTPSPEPNASPDHPERYHNVSFVIPIRESAGHWFAYLPSGGGHEAEVPLEPFLGIMGVAQDTNALPSSVPPGRYGGNLDLHNLTAGSTLYLPVLVPGAQFFVSDSHFAQGNGEVSLTAIEASLRATLRLTVLKKGAREIPMPTPLEMPFAETSDYWIPIGIAPELDGAMNICIHQGIAFLEHELGFEAEHALAMLSIGADFNISEVVDRTQEIHALIPKSEFPWIRNQTTNSKRR